MRPYHIRPEVKIATIAHRHVFLFYVKIAGPQTRAACMSSLLPSNASVAPSLPLATSLDSWLAQSGLTSQTVKNDVGLLSATGSRRSYEIISLLWTSLAASSWRKVKSSRVLSSSKLTLYFTSIGPV